MSVLPILLKVLLLLYSVPLLAYFLLRTEFYPGTPLTDINPNSSQLLFKDLIMIVPVNVSEELLKGITFTLKLSIS